MSSKAAALRDLLFSLTTRVREIRAISLVDRQGLPLVSTLGSGNLEEALGAFAGAMATQVLRAQRDFDMGQMYMVHFLGRDRQLFVAPVHDDAAIAAIVEAHATPTTIAMHLMALTQAVLPLLPEASDEPEEGAEDSPGDPG